MPSQDLILPFLPRAPGNPVKIPPKQEVTKVEKKRKIGKRDKLEQAKEKRQKLPPDEQQPKKDEDKDGIDVFA